MADLIKIEIVEPEIPEDWDYNESVKRIKNLIYKWKNLTIEIAKELQIAKRNLAFGYGGDRRSIKFQVDKSQLEKTWTQYCEDIGHSKRVVDRWLDRYFPPIIKLPSPKGSFDIIYADPPWKYDFSVSESRAIESHYCVMTIEEIKKMKIPDSKNAVLFLWATAPKLQEALEIIITWGFEYKTHAIWDKEIIGMGYWFRGQHELLLVSTKGKSIPPETTNRFSSIIREKRKSHSRKPEKVYEILESMFPEQKKIELFATKRRPGWIFWGISK